MKQETIQQSREQLEEAFSQLGKSGKSKNNTLYIILGAVAMLIIGMIVGGIITYDMTDTDEMPQSDTTAVNLMHQISAIDSSAQVSVNINDTVHTYLITKQDSVK